MEQRSARELKGLKLRMKSRARKLIELLSDRVESPLLIKRQAALIFQVAELIYGEAECQEVRAQIRSMPKQALFNDLRLLEEDLKIGP